jgi:serine/threonine-protein kinase
MKSILLVYGLALASLLSATPAAAQKAEANVLFDEGRHAMANHDYAQAIAKLEQSQQLDPAVGTLLNLAECYAETGRSASAWATFRDAASLAATTKQLDRERYATRRAEQLESKLSRLEVSIKPEARVPGLRVSRSGVPIPEGLWGSAVPVDPGPQHLEANAPDHSTWMLDVKVGDGAALVRVEIPALAPLAPAPTAVPAPPATPATSAPAVGSPLALDASANGAATQRSDSPRASASESSSLATLGWITAGVGAAATVAGVVFYINGQMQISDANCPNQVCVRGIGDKSLHDDGRQSEKLGIGLGIAGLAIAGAGVILALSAPEGATSGQNSRPTLALTVTATHADLRGTW